MQKRPKRGVSVGTLVMAVITVAVAAGCAIILPLFDGHGSLRADRVLQAMSFTDERHEIAEIPLIASPAETAATPEQTPLPSATPQPTPSTFKGGSFTVTAGGIVAVEKNVRQSEYDNDTGIYDYSGVFSFVSGQVTGDFTLVTMENLVNTASGLSALVAPEEIFGMLTSGGVDAVALGFGRVYEYGYSGLSSTIMAAQSAGLEVLGSFLSDEEAAIPNAIQTVGGVKVALLHCAESLTSKSRSNLRSDGRTWAVSTTQTIVDDIALAKRYGAQAVIVSVHWGSEGKTAPTNAQRQLAQQMADAGADVILGSGARRVQTAQWLQREDGGKTLCLYDLGCLVSDARTDGAVAGMLAQLTIDVDSAQRVTVRSANYVPTYLWRQRDGSKYRYRLLDAGGEAPEGMSAADSKAMQKALKRVRDIMDDTPLEQE